MSSPARVSGAKHRLSPRVSRSLMVNSTNPGLNSFMMNAVYKARCVSIHFRSAVQPLEYHMFFLAPTDYTKQFSMQRLTVIECGGESPIHQVTRTYAKSLLRDIEATNMRIDVCEKNIRLWWQKTTVKQLRCAQGMAD